MSDIDWRDLPTVLGPASPNEQVHESVDGNKASDPNFEVRERSLSVLPAEPRRVRGCPHWKRGCLFETSEEHEMTQHLAFCPFELMKSYITSQDRHIKQLQESVSTLKNETSLLSGTVELLIRHITELSDTAPSVVRRVSGEDSFSNFPIDPMGSLDNLPMVMREYVQSRIAFRKEELEARERLIAGNIHQVWSSSPIKLPIHANLMDQLQLSPSRELIPMPPPLALPLSCHSEKKLPEPTSDVVEPSTSSKTENQDPSHLSKFPELFSTSSTSTDELCQTPESEPKANGIQQSARKRIRTESEQMTTLSLVPAPKRSLQHSLTQQPTSHLSVRALSVLANMVISASVTGVQLWSLATMCLSWRSQLESQEAFGLAVNEKEKFVVSGHLGYFKVFWFNQNEEVVDSVCCHHNGKHRAIAVFGDQIFTSSEDPTVQIWRVESIISNSSKAESRSAVTFQRSLTGHTDLVTALLCAEGRLISASRDCTIRIWRISDLECIQTLAHSDTVLSICVANARADIISGPNSPKSLISCGDNTQLQGNSFQSNSTDTEMSAGTESPSNGNQAAKLSCSIAHSHSSTCLDRKSPTSDSGQYLSTRFFDSEAPRLFAGGFTGEITVWDMTSWSPVQILRGHGERVTALSCAGSHLVSGYVNGNLKFWDARSLSVASTVSASTSNSAVRTILTILPSVEDQAKLMCISGHYDGSIHLFNNDDTLNE
eukprot:981857_1